MILSVSRRTDIPAFYSEWFYNRIKEGYLLTRNPRNYHQVHRINLSPEVVDCIVFWTKDPRKMMDKLYLLNEYMYYFQFTLTSYDVSIETKVPRKKELIEAFIELSKRIGKKRVIWRYDPILLTSQINEDYHFTYFEYLAKRLHPYTNKCIISFLDMYKNTIKHNKHLNFLPIDEKRMRCIVTYLSNICKKYNLKLATCCENIDLKDLDVSPSMCIDGELISELIGEKISQTKDKNQRPLCGCISSIDIGAYNTCDHKCLYCYANYIEKTVESNRKKHSPDSPLLIGDLEDKDKIYIKEVKSLKNGQLNFIEKML